MLRSYIYSVYIYILIFRLRLEAIKYLISIILLYPYFYPPPSALYLVV